MTKRTKIIIAVILVFLFGPWLVKTGVDVIEEAMLRFNPDISIYELPPELCRRFFGCTPSEFFDKTMVYYDSEVDFRKRSKMDKNGNLVLVLNEQDKEAWKSALKDYGFLEAIWDNPNIIITDDYKSMTVNCYKETASADTFDSVFGVNALLVYQLFDGVPPDEIGLNYIIMDGITGEIVYSERYPENEINFSTKGYNFSSIYSK